MLLKLFALPLIFSLHVEAATTLHLKSGDYELGVTLTQVSEEPSRIEGSVVTSTTEKECKGKYRYIKTLYFLSVDFDEDDDECNCHSFAMMGSARKQKSLLDGETITTTFRSNQFENDLRDVKVKTFISGSERK